MPAANKTRRLMDIILAQGPLRTGALVAASGMSANIVSALMCLARVNRRVWRDADRRWHVTDAPPRKVSQTAPPRGRGQPISIRGDTARQAATPPASVQTGTPDLPRSPLTAPPYKSPPRVVREGAEDFRRIKSRYSEGEA